MSELPRQSPARWLKPGEWSLYCPRCGWSAPKSTVGGELFGCGRCRGALRVAEVRPDGSRHDFDHEPLQPVEGVP
jgi:hypothetical protein